MKQLYKYSFIQILTKEQLLKFDYNNYSIKQIESIGEDVYSVEVLAKGAFIDRLQY